MSEITFEDFAARQRAKGFDAIVEPKWGAKVVVEAHTHPFSVEALVVQARCGSPSATTSVT